MKAIQYILSVITILIIAAILGRFLGRYAAQLAFERQSHKTTMPLSNSPTYEYASEVSTDCPFQQYVSSEHHFKVRFRSVPTITTVGAVTQYATAIDGEGSYTVIVNSLKTALINDEDITSCLQEILQGRLSVYADKANLTRSRGVRILGQHALEYEYTIDTDGHILYSRGVYLLKGTVVYGITVLCLEHTRALAYPQYDCFIRSFELIE